MVDDIEIDGNDRPITSQFGRGQPSRRKKWTRRILTIGIALGALTAFVVIVFSAYDRGRQPPSDKAAPVIRAEDGPMKIRPKQPGGMDVPNQDKQIYGRISPVERPPQIEHLIPPPEVDVARPPPPPPPSPSPQTAAVPAPPPTVVSRPLEPIEKPALTTAAPQPAAAPEPPPAPAKAKAPPPPPAQAASAPRAASPPKPPRAAGGRYRVQLASLRSEAAAKSTWARLSKRDADLFAGLRSSVVRVDLGRKGVFYRLQAGPLADEAAARALCSRAKQRKLGCIVVRP